MTAEMIPSALLSLGSGGIVGFVVGFALKKVMKILAIIAGIFLGSLIYLQSQSIIAVNWEKLQSILQSTLPIINNSISDAGLANGITGIIGMPLLGGLSAGLVLGLAKG